MTTKAFDEHRDRLIMGDFWNLEAHIRETSDVVMEWLVPTVTYPLEVILVARLFAGSYEVTDECLA